MKIGIRVHSIESVDQLWSTCCALHNMFLIADGLSETWAEGGVSDWQGEIGLHHENDVSDTTYDVSGMGHGNDRIEDEDEFGPDFENDSGHSEINNGISTTENFLEVNELDDFQYVRNIHYSTFRQKLVNHFDILFQQNKIRWPTRTGKLMPSI